MMTLKGSGASQACAVCKYQRRRCTKDCLLAPYFPADQPKVFQNAHRLFGVSNIQKILKEVHPDQREEAVKSIKYESYIRARFPVHGCCEVIWQLRYQLHLATDELRYVRTRLALAKAEYGGETSERSSDFTNPNNFLDDNAFPFVPNDFLPNGGYNGNCTYAEPAMDMKPFLKQPHLHQFPYYNNFYDHNNRNCNNNNDNNHNINDATGLQQGFLAQQEIDVPQDYDEIPFDTIADDRQSYIESKEACESSAESMLKDEFVVENELKNAAACFSLTSTKLLEDRRMFL